VVKCKSQSIEIVDDKKLVECNHLDLEEGKGTIEKPLAENSILVNI
jgi:hypothetical protein